MHCHRPLAPPPISCVPPPPSPSTGHSMDNHPLPHTDQTPSTYLPRPPPALVVAVLSHSRRELIRQPLPLVWSSLLAISSPPSHPPPRPSSSQQHHGIVANLWCFCQLPATVAASQSYAGRSNPRKASSRLATSSSPSPVESYLVTSSHVPMAATTIAAITT